VANSNMVAFSKTGKALCSLLFTSFMNVNWFIKAGLLKWNKKYWGEKQNLVRIWVAIYSLYPSIVAYKRAAGESARQKVEKGRISKEAKSSLFESQLDVFKTVMDFLTFVALCVQINRLFIVLTACCCMSSSGTPVQPDTMRCCSE